MKFFDIKEYGDMSGTVHQGDMDISNKGITSLEGMPEAVAGNFDCSNNKLTSLQGMASSICGDFDCRENKLTSLEGIAKFIGGNFNCGGNQLTSIIDAFDNVKGYITCDYGIYPYHMEALKYRHKNPNLSDIVFKIRMFEQTKCEYFITQKEYEDYIEEHPEYAF